MIIKKCNRCGSFFSSEESVCQNCIPKDKAEISKLKNFFENASNDNTINDISNYTGISEKNINRYLQDKEVINNISNAQIILK